MRGTKDGYPNAVGEEPTPPREIDSRCDTGPPILVRVSFIEHTKLQVTPRELSFIVHFATVGQSLPPDPFRIGRLVAVYGRNNTCRHLARG